MEWPEYPETANAIVDDLEIKTTHVALIEQFDTLQRLEFSQWSRMKKVMSWLLRLLQPRN